MSLVNLGLRLMLSTLNNGGSGVAGGLDKADSQSGSTAASLSQVYLTIILKPLLHTTLYPPFLITNLNRHRNSSLPFSTTKKTITYSGGF